jgi:hypothetical protein
VRIVAIRGVRRMSVTPRVDGGRNCRHDKGYAP